MVGAAGPVLAHRLSENPNISVLLIEAGNSNDTLFAKVPLGSGRLWRCVKPPIIPRITIFKYFRFTGPRMIGNIGPRPKPS